jgi:hypothetical protein
MVSSKKTPKAKKHWELNDGSGYCPPRLIIRSQRSYARRRKQDVLLFLVHHRIPTSRTNHKPRKLATLPDPEEGYRRPTAAEAARYFNIASENTVRSWWREREKIFGKVSITKSYPLKWPALENELVKRFEAARKRNKIVTIHWFRRISQLIWKHLYPNLPDLFVFSNGWFWRFLQRHNIVRRRITKVATKPPEKIVKITNAFIQYI